MASMKTSLSGLCWCSCVRWLLALVCFGSQTEAFISVTMYPDESVFLVKGDPLAINCTITTSDNTASVYSLSIVLKEGSTGRERDLTNFSTYYPEEATVAVNIPETTLEDNGTYMCYYDGKFKSLKVVRIGEMPEPPKSINCVSLNFKQMTCYVELSQKETYIPTQWTMEYRTRSHAETLPCTKYNASYLNCGNITGSTNYRIFVNYTLTVTGFSEDFNVTLQNVTYVYTAYDIVKPNPVRDLNWTKTDNSSVVILHWKFPAQLGPAYISLSYRVNVRAEKGWDDRTLLVDYIASVDDMDHLYSYTVQDLIPYANYTVSLSAKPVKSCGELYWSDPSSVRLTTDSDVPGASVSLVQGSYYVLENGQNHISSVIYWKNPERRLSHGEITGYQLTISQIDRLTVEPWSSTVEAASHNALPREVLGIMGYDENVLRLMKILNETGKRNFDTVDFKLLKNKSYLVEVKTGSEKGFSDAVSQLVLPLWNKVEFLSPHRVIVEMDENSHMAVVSWQMRKNISCEHGLQEMVYWCTVDKNQGNQTYALCQDDFEWKTTNITDSCSNFTQEITLPADKNIDSLMFGVSMAINDVSGGIQWESCRFDAMYRAPDIPLYRVDSVTDKHTELQITVLYENCYSREGGRPTTYQVVHEKFAGNSENVVCPEGADVVSYPVDFDQLVMDLDNLEAGTQYVVCLRAINRYHPGNYGKPTVVRTSAPEKENLTWIWVTFGVVPGVIILLVFAVCVVRYVRRRMRPIEISDIPVHYKEDIIREGQYRYSTQIEGSQNGNGSDSGVDWHNSEHSSVSGPNDSGVPILAQQFSSTANKNSKSPSPERRRKISPSLSGYQTCIPMGNDIVYDECEVHSLIDNEDPEDGNDNHLNAEILKRIQEHDPGVTKGSEFDLSKIAQYDKESDKVTQVKIDKQDKIGGKDASITGDRIMGSPMNQEYVEEDDMHKLAAKHNNATSSKMDNSVAAKSFNDGKSLYSIDDTLSAKMFTYTTLAPHSEVSDYDINNGIKSDSFDKSLAPDSSVIENPDENVATDTKFPELLKIKLDTTDKSALKKMLPNGLNHSDIFRPPDYVKDDIVTVYHISPMELNTDNDSTNDVNEYVPNTDEKYANGDDSLSDIDHFDNDSMFNPSSGYGDGQLTEILETLTNGKNKSDIIDFGQNTCMPANGYVDADQISICSFVSNASSLQDRQSPEKKVGVKQGSEHSSIAASPVLPRVVENIYKGAVETENKTASKIENQAQLPENTLKREMEKNQDRNALDKVLDDLSTSKNVSVQEVPDQGVNKEMKQNGIDKKLNKSVKDLQSEKTFEQNGIDSGINEIKKNTSSGTLSGSGISSYVTAGKVAEGVKGSINSLSNVCNETENKSKEILTDNGVSQLENISVSQNEINDRDLPDTVSKPAEEEGVQVTRL